jgi:hypothetical protein
MMNGAIEYIISSLIDKSDLPLDVAENLISTLYNIIARLECRYGGTMLSFEDDEVGP